MSPKEFEALMRATAPNLESVVAQALFAGTPAAFEGHPAEYDTLCITLSQRLKVPKSDVVVVGSARTGFSLDQINYGTPFGPHSDIDVVIVSQRLFDTVWIQLYRCRLSNATLPPQIAKAREEHRQLIFYGRAFPHRLFRVTAFAASWVHAFASLGLHPEFAAHEVHGMLFRSWEHATGYYAHGLGRLLRALTERGEN
jgi:hypothetical protein